MIMPVSSSLSALTAYRERLDVTAHNVANVETDGFKKNRALFSESADGGVTVSVQRIDTPGIPKETIRDGTVTASESSNVDLVMEMSDMITTTAGYKANLNTVRTQDRMLGVLLDMQG